MALIRWDPFAGLARLDREFDDIIRRTWGLDRTSAARIPATDVTTDGEDVRLVVELPGLDPADIDIEVAPGRLSISGRHSEESESKDERGKVWLAERRTGSFRRDFGLPDGVTADQVEAFYDRGLLEVRVKGVARPAVETRKVEVQTGRAARKALKGSQKSE